MSKITVAGIGFLGGIDETHLDFDNREEFWDENLFEGWNKILGLVAAPPDPEDLTQSVLYVKVKVKAYELTKTFILKRNNSYVVGYVDEKGNNRIFDKPLDYHLDPELTYKYDNLNVFNSFYFNLAASPNEAAVSKGVSFNFSTLFISEAARFQKVRANVIRILNGPVSEHDNQFDGMIDWKNYHPFITSYGHIRDSRNGVATKTLIRDRDVKRYFDTDERRGLLSGAAKYWFGIN